MAIGRSLMTVFGLGVVYVLGMAVFEPLETKIFEKTTNADATTGLEWTTAMFEYYLFVVLAVCALGTIAVAVYQRRGLR